MDRSRKAVKDTYDRIAAHFSKTREYAWPEVASFLDAQPPAETALDIGCGNGRHTELLAEKATRAIGLDASIGLLGEARARATDRGFDAAFVAGDAASLPFAANSIDLALYVATLHHLPERSLRRASLDELARVLEPEARALVSVWSTAHDAFDHDGPEGFDTLVDWTLPGGETVPRFYHIYAPAEFDADFAASDLRVVSNELSGGNCYTVVTPE
ncbi:class I SAM-dependent methyltransferase [Haladaptatus sp. GCM10025707]|uniref:class I SAM-dependent methyltransferase n=1 Tax=Haladaptatus sp. GCM10025707 TaxID=3252658 RepID=UPI003611F449